MSKKLQNFGEGQGWVVMVICTGKKDQHENFVNVAGNMLEAQQHGCTRIRARGSQVKPVRDFKVMHGLFINHGIQDCFTIIADRVDWFHS